MREIEQMRDWLKFTPSGREDFAFQKIIDEATDEQILVLNGLYYALSEDANEQFIKITKQIKKHI